MYPSDEIISPDPTDSSTRPVETPPLNAVISSTNVCTRRTPVTFTTDGPMMRASVVKSLPTEDSSETIAASRIARNSALVCAYRIRPSNEGHTMRPTSTTKPQKSTTVFLLTPPVMGFSIIIPISSSRAKAVSAVSDRLLTLQLAT